MGRELAFLSIDVVGSTAMKEKESAAAAQIDFAEYRKMVESTPLEQVSDRVIDIAGHMQKYAEPNAVAIPKSAIKPLAEPDGFSPTDKVIDGLEVYTWRRSTTAPPPPASS